MAMFGVTLSPPNCRVLKAGGHFTLFGTYSSFFTPIMAEQKCAYCHVWGDPVPPNCRVLRADGHFTVARTLYYPYYELRVPGSKGYLVYIAPLHP